ncbi:response regulator transcription factor [Acidovorax sp. BL-A-41-H1]|uniref:response regulator transcription factor n=1 Tax=Acidovorax sp. BL-A-41-H1 TaxID=3421102 RepID=UPI003F7A7FEF
MTRILIVEDQLDIRKLLRMTLEFDVSEIREAETGDAGWAMATEMRPDIVLLDVMLPGKLNGLEVCRLIKAEPSLKHTKVVMISARALSEDKEAGLAEGADVYMAKPFSAVQLIDVIYQLQEPDGAGAP